MSESELAESPARQASAFPPGVAFIDERYVPMEEAKIPVLDWGFLRSDATYDVVHVWKGRFFRLDKHLARFRRSIERLRMSLPYSDAEITKILRNCVTKAGFEDAYVEMVMTRGHSPTFSRDPREAINRFFAFALPFGWIADEEQRARGLHVAIARIHRIAPESVDPRVKNYHWLDLIAGTYEAYDRGAENVILTDGAGLVTEGPGFNVFAVLDGAIATPIRGVLEGITRQTALDLAAELGIEARVEPLRVETLRSANEVFLTSTAGGIVAITQIDGRCIGRGEPGPVTRRMTELYWKKHSDPAWTTPVAAG